MAHRITGIDHLLLAVRDLEAGAGAFGRLGFTTTPKGSHAEWGTANRCLMFGQGYIELIAAAGEGPGARRVDAFLDRAGEGLMSAAFGTSDAPTSYRSLREAGVQASEPATLSRRLADDGVARFSVVDLAGGTTPGFDAFLCQHLTPELLRRPDWVDHPNGATSLVSLTAVLDHPETFMAEFNRVFGPAASTPTDDMVTVHTGRGLIYLVNPEGFEQLHPSLHMTIPQPPALVAATVGVADLDRTAAWLRQNGVRVTRKGNTLGIDAVHTSGMGLEFVEA
jgi:hypothetical protein